MEWETTLKERLNRRDILDLCAACRNEPDDGLKSELYSCIFHADDRVGYNALWVFTHFPQADIEWLVPKRNELVDMVLTTSHTGRRRLMLALLERLPVGRDDVRSDYLDFCLSKINSQEPYGIRALCIRQAFAQCRFYPELMAELKNEIELMEQGTLSPGLAAARRIIRQRISALKKTVR